jgi:hypothetical protein
VNYFEISIVSSNKVCNFHICVQSMQFPTPTSLSYIIKTQIKRMLSRTYGPEVERAAQLLAGAMRRFKMRKLKEQMEMAKARALLEEQGIEEKKAKRERYDNNIGRALLEEHRLDEKTAKRERYYYCRCVVRIRL